MVTTQKQVWLPPLYYGTVNQHAQINIFLQSLQHQKTCREGFRATKLLKFNVALNPLTLPNFVPYHANRKIAKIKEGRGITELVV